MSDVAIETPIAEYSVTAAALAELATKYKGVQYQVATTAGMKDAVTARAEIRTYRTTLEKKRVEIKTPALELCRLIDAEAKRITAALEALEVPIDAQIKAEEARKEQEKAAKAEAERQRITAIHAKIGDIRNRPATLTGKPSETIQKHLDFMSFKVSITEAEYQEFMKLASEVYTTTIRTLQEMLEAAQAHEAEQLRIAAEREELARLRQEAEARETELIRMKAAEEERIRNEREAEERRVTEERAKEEARIATERAAEEARLKAIREEEEAKLKAEREEEARKQALIQAEQEAKNIAERAAVETERQAAAEVARQQAAEQARLDAERAELARQQAEQEELKRLHEERRKKLESLRRDDPRDALVDILAIVNDLGYSDTEARNDVGLIAEASL